MRKRGQVWTADFIIGLLLFIFVIFIMLRVFMSMNITEQQSESYIDAIHISSELIAGGYPKNWTNSTVIIPGICENNRVDMGKLQEYSRISYPETKQLYQVSSDFIFFFNNGTTVLNFTSCTYGFPIGVDENCTPILSSLRYDDLAKIDRLVVINETVMRLTVYAWN